MISKKGIEGTDNVLYCVFGIKVFNSWNIIMDFFNVVKISGYKVVELKWLYITVQ